MNPCCTTSGQPLKVTQGQKGVPFVFTITSKSTGQPVPLNTATQITTNYLDADGVTVLTHKLTASQLTLVNGGYGGSFQDVLSDTETASLNPGTNPIIVSYTIGGIVKIEQLDAILQVVAPNFPPVVT